MLNKNEKNTILHKMNGTVKLVCLMIISILLFQVKQMYLLNSILGMVIVLFLIARIRWKKCKRQIQYAISFILLTFVLNLLFSDIVYSFLIAYRLFIMLLITILVAHTTKTLAMVDAIANLCIPLQWIRISKKEIRIMAAIGISFMPILKKEYEQIKQAQKIKGYEPRLREIKKYSLCIFIPFLSNCFKRVDEITLALEIKGYEE